MQVNLVLKCLNDGWTAVTKDKSLSAQFEHTLGITENGYEIFTESAKGYSKPLTYNNDKKIFAKRTY